jgi:pantetheine-phosphate adenylyltransferase
VELTVAADDLLKNKAHADLIEPLETRIQNVREFVLSFNRYIDYEIVPINDVYGPTATDANIQALVLSTESAEGGEMGKSVQ